MKLFLLIFASSFIFVSMKKTTTKRPKTTTKRTTTKRPSGTLKCFDCNSYDDNCGDFDESSSGSWETCSRSDYCIKQTMTNPEDGRKYSEHACAQSLWIGAENGDDYCHRKGNGCHKEKNQVDEDGATIKDNKICCCDSHLCNSSGVAQVSVVALTAVVMAMLHY